MRRTAIINVVGLTHSLIGPHTPRIAAFKNKGGSASITPVFPAVTCSAQSTYLTGTLPSQHGIVGNGWYHRELAEVQFWKQSNHLVQGRKLWEELRPLDSKFTCAKLFWWYNMYSTADYSITPRPMYPADGRKVFDTYTSPFSIRAEIKRDLGDFPFPAFWGPAAGVRSPQGPPDAASRWIAESAKWIENRHHPTLSLIYLPHLDYNLQRHGPFVAAGVNPPDLSKSIPAARPLSPSDGERARVRGSSTGKGSSQAGPGAYGRDPLSSFGGEGQGEEASKSLNPAIIPDLRTIDAIVGDLLDFYAKESVQVILLSEYGITNVNQPVHLNRLFRAQGWLAIKDELGLELLDCGASKVFAVADHQVAHIYLNDRSLEKAVRDLLEKQNNIEQILGPSEKQLFGIDHPRSGDLIAVAKENAWFTYYYWLNDSLASDFARTVDIHRKPGYDPVELFLDPGLNLPRLRIAWRLLQKKLGFRMLMDVIPLDANLVKGSHGRRPTTPSDFPIFISPRQELTPKSPVEAANVYSIIKHHLMQ